MKKAVCILLTVLFAANLMACGDSSTTADENAVQSQNLSSETAFTDDGIDVDLTQLSSTMVYSEVYNMMYTPDDYIGKTVKMKGQFAYYEDPETKAQYFACIIADATACCSQGLEFILTGKHSYPNDYPELGSEITVTGIFEVYTENGFQYCRLKDASLM